MRNRLKAFDESAQIKVFCEGHLLNIHREFGESYANLRVDFENGTYTIETNE